MMNRLFSWITNSEESQSAKSFSAFRVAFCLVLLIFIAHITYYRPLIFNSIPNIVYNPFPAKIFLVMWGVVVSMLLVGWQTKIVSVINYAFVVIATFLLGNTGSGSFNDDLLRIGSFLLMIMPINRYFSIDAIIKNLRYGIQPEKPTSSLYYTAAVLVSLGVMYFASSLTKLYSPMWQKGLGLWIPASMPYNKWHAVDFYLNSKWFMMSLNYITMLWELLFVFMLFSKRWRALFAISGIAFHLGIALIFPFPLLCIGPISFYFLFIPDNFWNKFRRKHIILVINPASKRQRAFSRFFAAIHKTVEIQYQDTSIITVNEQRFHNNWRAASHALQQTFAGKPVAWLLSFELFRLICAALIDDAFQQEEHTPISFLQPAFKRFLLAVFCLMLVGVQLFYSSYHLISKIKGNEPKSVERKNAYYIRKDITDFSLKPSNLFRTLFGLNARGVFLDHSNRGTKTVFAIININKNGDTTWLPFFDSLGHTLGMNFNLAWSKYSFNGVCCGSIPNPFELEKTLWLWVKKNKVDTEPLNLHVLKRTYIYPKKFEPGYQQKMANLTWITIANVTWPEGKYNYRLFSAE